MKMHIYSMFGVHLSHMPDEIRQQVSIIILLAFSHFILLLCSFSLEHLPHIQSTLSISMYFVCRASNRRHNDCIPIHNSIKCAVFNLCCYLPSDEERTSLNLLPFHPFMGVYICVCLPSLIIIIFFLFLLLILCFYLLQYEIPTYQNCLILKYVMENDGMCVFAFMCMCTPFQKYLIWKTIPNIILNPNGMFVCMCKNKENFHKS